MLAAGLLVAATAGSLIAAAKSGGITAAPAGSGFAGVFVYRNDNQHTGRNLNETILSPATVNAATFGLLFTDPVDGQLYTQPLYVPNVAIPGQGTHNIVIVATELDSAYAFDADAPGAPLWHASFTDPAAGITAVPSSDTLSGDINPWIGITATPTIDPNTDTLYVVSKVKMPGPVYRQQLHALDITAGLERPGSPVTIAASYPGTGAGSSGGVLTFDPLKQNDRGSLAIVGGIVYLVFASHGDNGPYHGWVLGYDAATLAQSIVWNDTPNGTEGGIWQSGCGPGVDSAGNLYLITGNGSFDLPPPGGPDWGDTYLKLAPAAGTLSVADYFTPANESFLDRKDLDLGSGGNLILPDRPGPNPHLIVSAGKQGTIYLANRDDLGGFNSSTDNIVQELPGAIGGLFATPAYWEGTVAGNFRSMVYFVGQQDVPKMFTLSGGMLSTAPVSQAAGAAFGFPGASPSISANGTSGGILWAVDSSAYAAPGPAVLWAFDATDLSVQLYNSNQLASDAPGPANKFAVPTIANGKVYVDTQTQLAVYGALATVRATPTTTAAASPTATATPSATPTLTTTPTATATAVTATLEVRPRSIEFSKTVFGDTGAQSRTRTVTVRNLAGGGAMPAAFGSPTIGTGFTVIADSCVSELNPGGRCTIQVAFVPVAAGVETGTLQLNDNASNRPEVALMGTGVPPKIKVRPRQVRFGRIASGSVSEPVTIALTNESPVPVTIPAPSIAAPFRVVVNSCGELASGGGCAMSVEFAPQAPGRYQGQLDISGNAAGRPQRVRLSGAAR